MYYSSSALLRMTNAAITPGTQPQMVSISTMMIDPHPLSITASGGNIIDKMTLKRLIGLCIYNVQALSGYY